MISMTASSLYNLIDQIFIGWKIVILGNAATNVTFPLTTIQLTRSSFLPDLRNICHNLSLGFSTFVTQISITIVQILLNNALVYYGARSIYGSEIPLGAVGVILKLNTLVVNLFVVISQGGQPLYSYNMGAKKYSRIKAVFQEAVKLSLWISVPGCILFEFFPKPLLLGIDGLKFVGAITDLITALVSILVIRHTFRQLKDHACD